MYSQEVSFSLSTTRTPGRHTVPARHVRSLRSMPCNVREGGFGGGRATNGGTVRRACSVRSTVLDFLVAVTAHPRCCSRCVARIIDEGSGRGVNELMSENTQRGRMVPWCLVWGGQRASCHESSHWGSEVGGEGVVVWCGGSVLGGPATQATV